VKGLLRDALSSSSIELNTAHTRVPLRKFADRRVSASEKALRKKMRRASRAKRSEYDSFHEVRKAGKKLRYMLEFFGPVLRGGHDRTLKRLKKIQKRFGAFNDAVARPCRQSGTRSSVTSFHVLIFHAFAARAQTYSASLS
jgi:CHAD domain-containing protein